MRYMLVEVVEREIDGIIYDSYENAAAAMRAAWEETMCRTDDGEISEWWAWANDGPNHDNYDWKIIEIPDKEV